jgi:hypothetical protein
VDSLGREILISSPSTPAQQAAYGFWSARNVVLLLSPFVNLLDELGVYAHDPALTRTMKGLIP